MLIGGVPQHAFDDEPLMALRYITAELLVGGTIGMLGRFFLLALETMATAAAFSIGLSNPFGMPTEENEVLPPLVTFVTMSATALIFMTDLHWEVFRGIAASYDAIPVKDSFDVNFSILNITKILIETFKLALRISAPFILFAIITQLTISIINRLTPQISIYFIATPFLICGGLFLSYLVIKSYLDQFFLGFSSWLTLG
jgi:flagellar biosynthetic protein FliR